MSKVVIHDPNALAAFVTGLGGEMIPDSSFKFAMPIEKTREAIPQINGLGVSVSKVGEVMRDHPTQLNRLQGVGIFKLYKQTEKTDSTPLESLMRARIGK
jgi:hypothetical protein